MAERTVTVQLVFETETKVEYDGEEWTSFNLKSVRHVSTDIPEDAIFGIQESLAQSDIAYIGLPNAVISALSPGEYNADYR